MRRPLGWWSAILTLGLALRCYHFFRFPAVWQDEAGLILNILALPFEGMFGPLGHTQAAPPFFLIIERAMVLTLGSDGLFALRLVPFLASCLALVLFADLLRRVLPGWPGMLALILAAVSDRWLWHSCEVKPYSVDILVAVAVMWWQIRTESWSLVWRCLPAILVAPVMLWSSFTACFALGSFLVALLPSLRQASWGGRLSYVLLGATIGVAFLALVKGPMAAQQNPELHTYWTNHFPNWSRPWLVPVWTVKSWFEVARYNFMPLGQVLLPIALYGGWTMIRRGEGERAIAAILPLGLAFVAALMHRYPFGSSRLEAFAGPGLAWLAAEGIQVILPRIQVRSRYLALALLILFLLPVPQSIYRLVIPWPRPSSDEVAQYILDHRSPGDRIVVNHWEYEYYFRNTSGWRPWYGWYEPSDLPGDPGSSLWVVHTSEPTVEAFPFPLPAGWEVKQMLRWQGTRLFQLRRVGDTGPSGQAN